jgi:hypothetical protein
MAKRKPRQPGNEGRRERIPSPENGKEKRGAKEDGGALAGPQGGVAR